MVGFVSSRTGQPLPLEFTHDGAVVEVALPARMQVGGADTSAEAARLGPGLVQAPRYRFADDLASGRLIEVLADFPPTPTPVSVLYPSGRQLSPRVRVFIDCLVETIAPQLAPAWPPIRPSVSMSAQSADAACLLNRGSSTPDLNRRLILKSRRVGLSRPLLGPRHCYVPAGNRSVLTVPTASAQARKR